jgi:hypothetical protein
VGYFSFFVDLNGIKTLKIFHASSKHLGFSSSCIRTILAMQRDAANTSSLDNPLLVISPTLYPQLNGADHYQLRQGEQSDH